VEVQLTAYGAIRAHTPHDPVGLTNRFGAVPLARNEFKDGSCGAHPYTFATPGAARVVGISVSTNDDLSMLATHTDLEDTNLLDILARANTPGAQDTGAHVVLDHDVTWTLITGSERQVMMGPGGYVVAHHVALEFISSLRAIGAGLAGTVTAVPGMSGEVLSRITLQQKLEYAATILHCWFGIGFDDHAVGGRGGASGEKLILTFH
jgi:hypothetical protein